jgi:hypothetical protein
MYRYVMLVFALTFGASLAVVAQKTDGEDKPFDVRSSVGDLHVGKDANAQKAGLPLYPGARAKHEDDNDPLNFGLLTESFGLKVVVAKYESDDAPGRVIAYYRDKLKKYGKVLECHSQKEGQVHSADDNNNNDQQRSKELKCEGDNTGPVTELKVGTEDDQHVVEVESRDRGKGSDFAVIYVYTRGKRGDI